jgi:hypothetical protein
MHDAVGENNLFRVLFVLAIILEKFIDPFSNHLSAGLVEDLILQNFPQVYQPAELVADAP